MKYLLGFISNVDFDEHGDQIFSSGWRGDGSVLVTSCKDKKLRVFDPRTKSAAQVTQLLEISCLPCHAYDFWNGN